MRATQPCHVFWFWGYCMLSKYSQVESDTMGFSNSVGYWECVYMCVCVCVCLSFSFSFMFLWCLNKNGSQPWASWSQCCIHVHFLSVRTFLLGTFFYPLRCVLKGEQVCLVCTCAVFVWKQEDKQHMGHLADARGLIVIVSLWTSSFSSSSFYTLAPSSLL